jgi:uncharacterized membrane-anchored protein YhcB (DUF1043 family)
MELNWTTVGMVVVLLLFGGIPITAIILEHFQKMKRLEVAKAKQGDSNLKAQLDAIRREIADLRQTSTEYCLSLDSNLQNLQAHIAHLESRMQEMEQQNAAIRVQ